MSDKQGYRLSKADRLSGRKRVENVFSTGKSFTQFPFRIVWLPENDIRELQAGFAVSSRYFKKAVDRNRIKRMMREAYRLQKNELSGFLKEKNLRLSVFILFNGKEMPGYDLVHEKMGKIIKRLPDVIYEKNQ